MEKELDIHLKCVPKSRKASKKLKKKTWHKANQKLSIMWGKNSTVLINLITNALWTYTSSTSRTTSHIQLWTSNVSSHAKSMEAKSVSQIQCSISTTRSFSCKQQPTNSQAKQENTSLSVSAVNNNAIIPNRGRILTITGGNSIDHENNSQRKN
jgi:hypothetical protein